MSNVGGNTAGQVQTTQENTNVTATENNQKRNKKLEFQDSNNQPAQQVQQQTNTGNKKSISDVLNKINKEMKSTSENLTNMLTDIKELKESVSSIDQRVGTLEKDNKVFTTKMADADENMGKFLSLYEVVNNQYNPFVTNEPQKEVVVGTLGNSNEELSQDELKEKIKEIDVSKPSTVVGNTSDESSLIELDTLNIEEAAGNAVPLTHLKTNTNSLVIILSWLEYLVKK